MPETVSRQDLPLNRRHFLGTLSGCAAIGFTASRQGKLNCFAAERTATVAAVNAISLPRRAPLLLNQRTLPNLPLAKLLHHSRQWGFDGVELALSRIVSEAERGKLPVSQVVKSAVESRTKETDGANDSPFLLCLAVDLDEGPVPIDSSVKKQLDSVLEHIELSECSIALSRAAAFDEGNWQAAKRYVEHIQAVRKPRKISVENPLFSSPVAVSTFLEGFKHLPEGVGLLIRSSEMRMRLDMGLQEVRFILGELKEKGISATVNGIRLEVKTSSAGVRDTNYQRELFRRALTEQAVSTSTDNQDLLFQTRDAFVSVESAQSLDVMRSNPPTGNVVESEIGSPVFNDVVAAIKTDVLNLK